MAKKLLDIRIDKVLILKINSMDLNQEVKFPKNPLPIVIMGAGSMIKDTHLPAYKSAGFLVKGIYNRL
jgi:hypothetical protein